VIIERHHPRLPFAIPVTKTEDFVEDSLSLSSMRSDPFSETLVKTLDHPVMELGKARITRSMIFERPGNMGIAWTWLYPCRSLGIAVDRNDHEEARLTAGIP
jgi:hypothetical protein